MNNMDLKYEFAIGSIKKVCSGNADLKGSLDDLDLSEDSGVIYIPKIIGIYQKELKKDGFDDILGELEQLSILSQVGEMDPLNPDLIGVLYDPTTIKKDILTDSIKDPLNRLKITSYDSFEADRLYDKNLGELNIFTDVLLDPSDLNFSLLENKFEVLKILRQDYGLTRNEAIHLLAIDKLLVDNGKKPEIIKGSHLTRLISDLLK